MTFTPEQQAHFRQEVEEIKTLLGPLWVFIEASITDEIVDIHFETTRFSKEMLRFGFSNVDDRISCWVFGSSFHPREGSGTTLTSAFRSQMKQRFMATTVGVVLGIDAPETP